MLDFFQKKKKLENLKDVSAYLEKLEKMIEKTSAELKNLKEKNKKSVQKVGAIRYNPFSTQGGDQSFSIVLLDGNNDGVVITSIYSREGNRTYAKPVEKGISKYSLSEEEKKAIGKAVKFNQ